MKIYLISDNVDTKAGMRLAGIEGVVLHEKNEVEAKLRELINDEEIGVILMTGKLMTLCSDLVYKYKRDLRRPLISQIPDRHGEGELSDAVMKYIREAIGLSI